MPVSFAGDEKKRKARSNLSWFLTKIIKEKRKTVILLFSLCSFLSPRSKNFFVFPDGGERRERGGGDPLSTCLYQLLTDLLSLPKGKEEKLFLRSPSFRALSRVKIIDPDSLSTKALQPYRRRTSPSPSSLPSFLPSSPSFRQKLNAAVHDRAEGPRLSFSRTDCSFRSEWATSCRVFRTPLTISLGVARNLTRVWIKKW